MRQAFRRDRRARAAAIAVAWLSLATVGVRMLLLPMLGVTAAGDLGRGAADADLARALPLLALAELLKLAGGAAQTIVVSALARGGPAPRLALLTIGTAGALLIAVSGLAGFYAVVTEQHSPLISAFGFAGIAATGIWALLLVGLELPQFERWHAGAGLFFGGASLAALAVPPAALLSVVIGWAWWLGLARRLRRG